jgi:hypothetical protein
VIACRKPIQLCAATIISAYCFFSLGCTPKIPTQVTSEEMNVYSEWLRHYFVNKPPEQLYLDNQTFIFDPLDRKHGFALPKDSGITSSLPKELHALRKAEYPVEVQELSLPWPYKVLNPRQFPNATPGLHIIGFSRVAFNNDHTEALFAISDACAVGECGHGGPVHGRKQSGKWVFTDMPGWVY